MGAGRSGSTLLDILFGNNENVVSLGEINRFARRGGYPPKVAEDTICFSFWSKIRDELSKELKNPNWEKMEALSRRFEYYWWFFLFPFYSKKSKQEYLNYTQIFLNKVYENLDSEQVAVDSSKYPARAIHLGKLNIDLTVVYIQRSMSGVINSLLKKNIEQPSKSRFGATLYYIMCNLLCHASMVVLRLKGVKVVKIRFEDLINNTPAVLNKIMEKTGLNMEKSKRLILDGSELDVGRYIFDGNRIRHKETIKLENKVL